MEQKIRKKLYKDNVKYYPPCGLVRYVSFVNGVCPYSGCKSCSECLATEMDVQALEMLKFTRVEDLGLC